MAANLLKAGHNVVGFDLALASCEAAARGGVRVTGTAAESVKDADVVITMLPAGKNVLAVWTDGLLPQRATRFSLTARPSM
jgi:3-hydroxyisobutyrate dehydrogenase